MEYMDFSEKFEEVLAANAGGDVVNLLITDGDPTRLDDALYALRNWSLQKDINLVELDEGDDSWVPKIQSRELFDELNRPNTVLLVKNYATVHWLGANDNNPHSFLRDAALNRHYGCGNDFWPSDALPNLLFVVAWNDLREMYWDKKEISHFEIARLGLPL